MNSNEMKEALKIQEKLLKVAQDDEIRQEKKKSITTVITIVASIIAIICLALAISTVVTRCQAEKEAENALISTNVENLTISFVGATLYNDKQYNIYTIEAPYVVNVIYEGDEQAATQNYIALTDNPSIQYIASEDSIIRLVVNGEEINIDVNQYQNDDIFESDETVAQ